MIELELNERHMAIAEKSYATGWRLESSLREFPNIKPLNFWFEHPIHRVDENGDLDDAFPSGSAEANLAKSSKRNLTPEDKRQRLCTAYDIMFDESKGGASLQSIADYLEVGTQTIRNYVKEFKDEFNIAGGIVIRLK